MLNRKESKTANGAANQGNGHHGRDAAKNRRPRRRFIISPKAAMQHHSAPAPRRGRPPKSVKAAPPANSKAGQGKISGPSETAPKPAGSTPGQAADLTETIKTLLHLAHENGHVTYDDINDVLPEGLSPEDLDELYTKLRNLDVEIVDHAEVERAKPTEPEEEEDSRLEVLDDPVRMYMNQMGKVPLLTREQEVEICKRIEEA